MAHNLGGEAAALHMQRLEGEEGDEDGEEGDEGEDDDTTLQEMLKWRTGATWDATSTPAEIARYEDATSVFGDVELLRFRHTNPTTLIATLITLTTYHQPPITHPSSPTLHHHHNCHPSPPPSPPP